MDFDVYRYSHQTLKNQIEIERMKELMPVWAKAVDGSNAQTS